MSNDNVKVQSTGAELNGWIDALQRIADAVKSYEQPMFVGGPKPSEVALALKGVFEGKLKDAPALTPPPRASDQR